LSIKIESIHPLYLTYKATFSNTSAGGSIVIRSAFVKDLDRTGTADTHALGMTAAQIAMVDVIIPLKNRMKGTRF